MDNTTGIALFGLDQDLDTQEDNWAIHRVRELVQKAIDNKDISIITSTCEQLVKIEKVTGKALAELFFLWEQNWELFGIDDDFVDYVFAKIGRHRHTVERYLKVGKLLHSGVIPVEYEERIGDMSIAKLIPVAHAFSQGYEIEEEQWKKIAYAPDPSTMNKIVREDVKEAAPRKSGISLMMNRQGNIYAYKQGMEKVFVGYLEIDNKDDEVLQSAINRIITNSGILKQ